MRRVTGIALVGTLLCLAAPAHAGPRYDPQRAGHPLRIAAYAAHPIGVILDTLIFHPAWWIGQHEPFRTLFGVTTPIADDAKVAAAQRASARPEPSAPEPTAPEPGAEAPSSQEATPAPTE